MGDSSEEEEPKEEEEEQEDEVKGLPRTPTGDTGSGEKTEGEAEEDEEKPEEGENQEVEDEGEEAKDSGGEEEAEAQGDLNSFEAPPVSYKPSPNGPEGKDWTRVDFIVDSGASDSKVSESSMAEFYQTWGPRRSRWHFNVARYSKEVSQSVTRPNPCFQLGRWSNMDIQ